MSKESIKHKSPPFLRPQTLFGLGKKRDEIARYEAFLDAVPGAYCGWAPDGTIAFSEGFCRLLDMDPPTTLQHVQNALDPGDSAALESLFQRLQDDGTPFTIAARTADREKTVRLSGKRGKALAEDVFFHILWAEDMTAATQEQATTAARLKEMAAEKDRLQTALDLLPVPAWLRDRKTALVWCNKSYAALVENSPAGVIAEQKEIPVKPRKEDPQSRFGSALAQKALDLGHGVTATGYVVVEGNRHLMELSELPLSSGGQSLTLGMARNINREEELEKSFKRYRIANNELLEQLATAIGIFDADQKLEFYNTSFAQLWQLEESYLNGKPKLGDLMEKLRESRRLPEQADFRKYKQGWLNMFTGLIDPHDDMLYLPDDTALRMLVVPHPMGGLMMTFENVTSRLELESSYNTLIAVQKETLDNLGEGVAVFGGDGRLKLWNPAFARLWRLHPEDLEGEPHINRLSEKVENRFTADQWPEARQSLLSQCLDRTLQDGRMICGDETLIAYATVPLPDGGVLVTHADITDKARVEHALRERNAALEEAERVKLDFLANVSYQLRTPLNAIMGFAEILENEYFGTLNERQHEYTRGLQEAGEKLLSLINNILDLSTIEAGYMSLQEDDVSIYDTLHDITALTEEWARKEKIRIKLKCPENIGTLIADERRLKQVLLNLIRNAITYTPERGEITLTAQKKNDMVTIIVSDTGRGIPPEDRERIFQPFERGRGEAESGGRSGAGLGLSLVRNIIALHQGTIELDSAVNKGTTVTIRLPVRKQA